MAQPDPSPRKGNIVVYSSCHTWSLVPYLRGARIELANKYNVTGVVIHLARDQNAVADPRFAKIFEEADVILHHPLDSDRWDGLRVKEFKLKPTCQLFTMESPQASCWWPVLFRLADWPAVNLLRQGASADDICRIYDSGKMKIDFKERLEVDAVRMHQRDLHVDVKSGDFVLKHWKNVKMFSTTNHPTYHVYVWMMDQFAGLLGFERRGEEEALGVRDFLIEGDGHYPETEYEWRHYGFTYNRRLGHCQGGNAFYHREIRKIADLWARGPWDER